MAQKSKDANNYIEFSFPLLYHRHPVLYPIGNKYYPQTPPLFNYLVAIGDKFMNIYFSVISINTLWVHSRVLTNDL